MADHNATNSRDAGDYSDNDIAECPVMKGTKVSKIDAEDEGLVRVHKGRRYYLCCDGCAPLFDADPDRYATV